MKKTYNYIGLLIVFTISSLCGYDSGVELEKREKVSVEIIFIKSKFREKDEISIGIKEAIIGKMTDCSSFRSVHCNYDLSKAYAYDELNNQKIFNCSMRKDKVVVVEHTPFTLENSLIKVKIYNRKTGLLEFKKSINIGDITDEKKVIESICTFLKQGFIELGVY